MNNSTIGREELSRPEMETARKELAEHLQKRDLYIASRNAAPTEHERKLFDATITQLTQEVTACEDRLKELTGAGSSTGASVSPLPQN